MATLSDAILKGSLEDVEALIAQGAPINQIDQYGFTPLIQACIKDDYDKAALLIHRGAEIDSFDITGSDALHWALDNSNYALCELLLQKGANANGYSHDGQPALIRPVLREQRNFVDLLYKYGAKLSFAQDYINTKLIGHRFELQGVTDIVDTTNMFIEVSFEGFFLEFTLGVIRDSLQRFVKSYEAHRIQLEVDELHQILETLHIASKLREMHRYNIDVENYREVIAPLIQRDLLLLPISFEGHAITVCQHGAYFSKCDRAENRMSDPIVIQHIQNTSLLNYEFYRDLLYKKVAAQAQFIKTGLSDVLGLKPLIKLPIKHQITGNCSWANVEAAIPAMLFMLLRDKYPDMALKALAQRVMHFYAAWKAWDKDRAIEDCLHDFQSASKSRQASKAALLGAVFFQALDPTNDRDIARAKKIIPILTMKEFRYVLRSYINVYIRAKKTHEGERLELLLQSCGLSYRDI